jgi:hypothetical protein
MKLPYPHPFTKVPRSLAETWHGTLEIYLPWKDIWAAMFADYDLLPLAHFLNKAPHVQVNFEDPKEAYLPEPPRILVWAMRGWFSRSTPSLVTYIHNHKDEMKSILIHIGGKFECDIHFHKAQAPAWLKEFCGNDFEEGTNSTWRPLNDFRPYNHLLGVIRPRIGHDLEVRIDRKTVQLKFMFPGWF